MVGMSSKEVKMAKQGTLYDLTAIDNSICILFITIKIVIKCQFIFFLTCEKFDSKYFGLGRV